MLEWGDAAPSVTAFYRIVLPEVMAAAGGSGVIWGTADTEGAWKDDREGWARVARSLRRQDGFVREVLWLALIVAVAALVVLDAMALLAAYRSTEDAAGAAALAARNTYFETQDVAAAERSAKASVAKNDKQFIGMDTSRSLDASVAFSVSAQGHAETYAFKYLKYVGLKGWVERMTNPTATESPN